MQDITKKLHPINDEYLKKVKLEWFSKQHPNPSREEFIDQANKELSSINFQYTLVKQIELEIEAVKKVGGRNIIGNEEFLNVPLEVPKVSFELKEIKNKTPTKDVVHNNVNNNNKKEQQMKTNNGIALTIST